MSDNWLSYDNLNKMRYEDVYELEDVRAKLELTKRDLEQARRHTADWQNQYNHLWAKHQDSQREVEQWKARYIELSKQILPPPIKVAAHKRAFLASCINKLACRISVLDNVNSESPLSKADVEELARLMQG